MQSDEGRFIIDIIGRFHQDYIDANLFNPFPRDDKLFGFSEQLEELPRSRNNNGFNSSGFHVNLEIAGQTQTPAVDDIHHFTFAQFRSFGQQSRPPLSVRQSDSASSRE
jgi:hypothetical protein